MVGRGFLILGLFCYWISDLGNKQCGLFLFNFFYYTFFHAMGYLQNSKLYVRQRFWVSVSFDRSCLIFVPEFAKSFPIRFDFFVISFHIFVICVLTHTYAFPFIILWKEIRRWCIWVCWINTILLDVSILFNKYLFEELCSLSLCKD